MDVPHFVRVLFRGVRTKCERHGACYGSRGEPLIGVTIQVQGTAHGTVTDFDGKYLIPAVPADAILEVSYVGMKSETINVNGRSVIDITLEEDTGVLEEVVVVGYGIQKKASVTAAISTVDTKDLKQSSAPNLSTAPWSVAWAYCHSDIGSAG